MVDELGDGLLTDPRSLNQYQITRLGVAIREGFAPIIVGALRHSSETTPEGQWRVLLPILEEAEQEVRAARSDPDHRPDPRPGRPRRMIRARPGLTIRRERAAEGWILRFTGPEATGSLMEDIMDEIERQYGRE